MSNKVNQLKAAPHGTYDVSVLADGTNTLVEITADDGQGNVLVVARGEARRRKGERRDEHVGQLIAFRRAFAEAAKHIDEQLAELGKAGWAIESKKINLGHVNFNEDVMTELIKKAKEAKALAESNGGEG